MKYQGAEIIIKLLEIHGVQRIAGIPGGANLPMYDALSRSSIRHILARHEQGAGFIAQGQARATEKVGVFFATSGPGATNALTAIADARLDSIPLVCITGQVHQALIGTDAFQEIDTYGLTLPITKHNYLVRDARDLLTIIPRAFQIAAEGRPGPVVIDVPKDVQQQWVEIETWPQPLPIQRPPIPSRSQLEEAASMIRSAERPVLYIGGGAIHSGAHQEIHELAQRLHAPVISSLMGLGAFPCDHPQFIGMLGMHAARYTNQILHECDTLIALGVRFDDRATGKVSEFCPNSRILHIDIDRSEIGKIKAAHCALHADLKDTLDALLPLVSECRNEPWWDRIRELKVAWPFEIPDAENPLAPYGMIIQAAAAVEGPSFITTDVGQHQMRVAQCYPFQKPRQWLTSGGLGTMGFGLPAAIGAALEHPDATVLCFTGDGSLLMNIQELVLIAEEKLNIKVILSNNYSLGLVHQQQQLFYGQRLMASLYHNAVDFVAIAKGFGVAAHELALADDPQAMLADLIRKPGGCLIHVPTDVAAHVFPMVPPGGSNREMLNEAPTFTPARA
jgi:acetolactate synthase I/II/III large subunit